MEQRGQFTFYRSFFEAIRHLEPTDRDASVMAICDYALNGNEHELSGVPAAVFSLVKPNLDNSRKKAESGSAGGKSKQTESKPQANVKHSQSKRENKNKKEKEIEVKKESLPPLPPSKEPKVQWADNVTMTNAEHQKLLDTHGPADTARLIEILDNYKGSSGKKYKDDYRAILSWCVDRLGAEKGKKPPASAQSGNPFLRRAKEMENL